MDGIYLGNKNNSSLELASGFNVWHPEDEHMSIFPTTQTLSPSPRGGSTATTMSPSPPSKASSTPWNSSSGRAESTPPSSTKAYSKRTSSATPPPTDPSSTRPGSFRCSRYCGGIRRLCPWGRRKANYSPVLWSVWGISCCRWFWTEWPLGSRSLKINLLLKSCPPSDINCKTVLLNNWNQ